MNSYPDYKRGRPLPLADLQRVDQAAAAASRGEYTHDAGIGSDADVGPEGRTVQQWGRPKCFAKITGTSSGGTGGLACYPWEEVLYDGDAWQTAGGGRGGDLTAMSLKEVNENVLVPENSIVEATLHESGAFWLFSYDPADGGATDTITVQKGPSGVPSFSGIHTLRVTPGQNIDVEVTRPEVGVAEVKIASTAGGGTAGGGDDPHDAVLGHYYLGGNPNIATVTTTEPTITADRLYAVPYRTGQAGTIDRIAFSVQSATAGNFGRVGIYTNKSAAQLYPDALVLDGGEFDCSTTGLKSAVVSYDMPGGILVWFVFLGKRTGVPFVIHGVENFRCKPVLGLDWSSVAHYHFWTADFTYAALPASFPAGGTKQAGNMHAIGVRYAAPIVLQARRGAGPAILEAPAFGGKVVR